MAAAKGWAVSTGVSDGSNPGNPVTRQQLVTLIWRAEGEPAGDVTVLADYPDAGSVSAYAKGAVAWAVDNGVISGTTAGTLNPQGNANRAQLAVILYRFCGQEAAVAEEYTVTFELNYGDTVSKSSDPSRSGYTFKSWSSFASLASASFTNCTFGVGSYYNSWPYNSLVKHYVNTVFTNCSFDEGYYLDLSALGADCTVTLANCTVNGVAITADICGLNCDGTETLCVELPSGRTLADCVIFQ